MSELNLDELINKLATRRADRISKTLYLSKSLYAEFEKECKQVGIAPSKLLEELIEHIIEKLKKRRT